MNCPQSVQTIYLSSLSLHASFQFEKQLGLMLMGCTGNISNRRNAQALFLRYRWWRRQHCSGEGVHAVVQITGHIIRTFMMRMFPAFFHSFDPFLKNQVTFSLLSFFSVANSIFVVASALLAHIVTRSVQLSVPDMAAAKADDAFGQLPASRLQELAEFRAAFLLVHWVHFHLPVYPYPPNHNWDDSTLEVPSTLVWRLATKALRAGVWRVADCLLVGTEYKHR